MADAQSQWPANVNDYAFVKSFSYYVNAVLSLVLVRHGFVRLLTSLVQRHGILLEHCWQATSTSASTLALLAWRSLHQRYNWPKVVIIDISHLTANGAAA